MVLNDKREINELLSEYEGLRQNFNWKKAYNGILSNWLRKIGKDRVRRLTWGEWVWNQTSGQYKVKNFLDSSKLLNISKFTIAYVFISLDTQEA